MNPMVRAYLERINTSLDDLQEAVQDMGGGLSHEKERSERLLKQYWNRGKELSVLQQTAGEMEAVLAENARLREAHAELEARLQNVLSLTKGILNELKS
jgi:predicted nuclease with TOPRIM domain